MLLPSDKLGRARSRVIASERLRPVRAGVRRALRPTYLTSRPLLIDRLDLPTVFNARRLLGCGFEVGVKEGGFSEILLDAWRGRHLVSVDPWVEEDAENYVDLANVDQATHDAFYEQTRRRLARFGDRSSIWRMTSLEAAERVVRHSLDFVYIDARHDYESVREDVAAWEDKVRPGGVIAGHDYVDGTFEDGEFGVRSAVDDHFGERGLPVGTTLLDQPWPTWFVLIPR